MNKQPSAMTDPLHDATVLHLQPDDIVVIRLAATSADREALNIAARRARDAFAPRRVVILAADTALGIIGDWPLP